MKKVLIVLFTIILVVLLTACKPASKNKVMQYAENEYGEAEFISEEAVSEDEITYYLKDKEYGFEYYVTSYVADILIDGSKFGESESKKSNFDKQYYSYVTKKLESEFEKLENTYKVEIITKTEDDVMDFEGLPLADVYYKESDTKTAPELSEKVKDLYQKYDNRNYWKHSNIYVYDQNKERIGSYDFENDMWMTLANERDSFYIRKSKWLNGEAEYVRKEQKLFKDTGLSLDDVYVVLGDEPIEENTVVTYYYFTVDGKEFFLADVMVKPDGNCYNNYDQVMGE